MGMKILGTIVFIAGVVLFLGNVLGFMRTFPGAGYLTIAAGGVLHRRGSGEA
jgi:hypothetical protein